MGAAAGIASAVLAVKLWRYLLPILEQPHWVSSAIFGLDQGYSLEERGLAIAQSNLLSAIEARRLPDGSTKRVLNAGSRNFREPWARDFGFASYGLLALGEQRAVRETLEAFLNFQKNNGQLPVKIHSTSVFTRFLYSQLKREQPIYKPLQPKYQSGHRSASLDGNALLVLAALNYLKKSGDQGFVDAYWSALKRGLEWLKNFAPEQDGLLYQSAYADWADSIARPGRVLYTNVVYWKAVREMAATADRLGKSEARDRYAQLEEEIAHAIQEFFWREDLGYFITHQRFENLSSSGNLLAIAWGLANPAQAESILQRMQEFQMAEPVPTQTVNKAYPRRFIALENRLGGIPYYHTRAAWLWLGAWHVIALQRTGHSEQAWEMFKRLAGIIVRDGEVHEVYTPQGNYIATRWYTSEAPLTWSAGMVVYAGHVLCGWSRAEATPRWGVATYP
jgi:GH15 family glucan-1,4-alpha-glucosidase